MAKKGKKGKGKKKKTAEDDPNALTEVDRTFYELTIADLNRKLARLRSLTQELEVKNEELTQEKDKLDEDRSDIITYLKRMLEEKTNEINELEERITGMQEERQNETEKYDEKISDLQDEYKQMHEQLTSENKLLDGKLNSLEEFRSQRDDLMNKFESQEVNMEAQEKRHKRELYEIERKFIISKDKLKKDMEARLLQLSTEFHDASELRIAATTHQVIRENIIINNELDTMLKTHQKLYKDHQSIKARDVTLRQAAELHEAEKEKTLAKVKVQKKIIEGLISEHKDMVHELNKYKRYEVEAQDARNTLKDHIEKNEVLEFKVKLLEQNIHKAKCDNATLKTEIGVLKDDNEKLSDIVIEGESCIKEALNMKLDSDPSIRASKRENLLSALFTLLNKAHDKQATKPSLETVPSIEVTYALGDLGFIPKPIEVRPSAPTKRNIESQTGTSFEEYLQYGTVKLYEKKGYADVTDSELERSCDEQSGEGQETVQDEEEEKRSVLFFSETIIEDEESEGDSKEFDPFADHGASDSGEEETKKEEEVKKEDEMAPSVQVSRTSSLKETSSREGSVSKATESVAPETAKEAEAPNVEAKPAETVEVAADSEAPTEQPIDDVPKEEAS